MERTIASNPTQAALGGDPSAANRVRAYLAVRFYRNGQWDDCLEVISITSSFWETTHPSTSFSMGDPCGPSYSTFLGRDA